jgi:hypothetical protein
MLLCFLRLFYILVAGINKLLEPKRHSKLKSGSNVLSVQINHEHGDPTVN